MTMHRMRVSFQRIRPTGACDAIWVSLSHEIQN